MHIKRKDVNRVLIACACLLVFPSAIVAAAEKSRGENASNPLAKVKNPELRWQYLDLVGKAEDAVSREMVISEDKLAVSS